MAARRRHVLLVAALGIVLAGALGGPAAADGTSPWPMAQHDAQHSGRAGVVGPLRHARERCTAQLTGTTEAGPAVVGADGTIFVTSGDSDDPSTDWRVHALHPDCSVSWTYQLPGWPARTTPALAADGTIYVHTNGAENISGPPHLVAVNPNGSLRWDFQYTGGAPAFATHVPGAPTVGADGRIWIGSTNTLIYAVTPSGGIDCSVQSASASSVDSAPALSPDGTTVYVLDQANVLTAVDGDCDVDWSLELSDTTGAFEGVSPAVATDGTVYVPVNTDLVAVDDGAEVWRAPDLDDWQVSTPAIGPDGTIYVEADGLAAISPDGQVAWSGRSCLGWTASSGGADDAPVVGSDGTIYYQQDSAEKMICAFHPDGARVWRLAREFGTAGSRLALTEDGAIVSQEGGLTTPPSVGIVAPAPRPDGRIKRGAHGAYVGNDVYNTVGTGQTRTGSAPRGGTVTYYVSCQNDAQFNNTLRLVGSGSTANFRLTYRGPAGANISARIVAGTYTTPVLAPGASQVIRVDVTVRNQAPRHASVSRRLTARSVTDLQVRDVVQFVTRRA